jgi:inhibitor of KinA sporulation pathway (predicted exonuclease)/predicted NAD-dependent protein-ADP-ribosyltransferase YbiA (DUF1768 family)
VDAETKKKYDDMVRSGPPQSKGKPSPDVLAALREHKAKVKRFLDELSPEQRDALTGKRRKVDGVGSHGEKTMIKAGVKSKTKKSAAPTLTLKENGFCRLGFPGDNVVDNNKGDVELTLVLPFYSHTQRSKRFAAEDLRLGIDRRVFSNLYADAHGKKIRVPRVVVDPLGKLLFRHAFLHEVDGVCSESFFQAAKCEHECDARFIMEDLNENDAAAYGQGRMKLTKEHVARLVALGADPSEFKLVSGVLPPPSSPPAPLTTLSPSSSSCGAGGAKNDAVRGAAADEPEGAANSAAAPASKDKTKNTNASASATAATAATTTVAREDNSPRYLRGADGKLPLRQDWEQVKISVMMHVLRAKFGPDAAGSCARASVAALIKDGVCPFFVEHTSNDAQWGDGGDGSGFNLLGKCLTRVVLELQQRLVPADVCAFDAVVVSELRRPNALFVEYGGVDHGAEPHRRSSPDKKAASNNDNNDNRVAAVAASAVAASAAAGETTAKTSTTTPDYLCVLDFEATCDDNNAPVPQEIIEFPTLLVNARTGQVEAEFHHYVTPDVHPQLTRFCTKLTGITQDMVSSKLPLRQVLALHGEWRREMNIVALHSEVADAAVAKVPESKKGAGADRSKTKTFLFLTCGDWDLKTCLPKQLAYHGDAAEIDFRSWVNIKKAFVKLYGFNPRGMTGMLDHLGMKLEGRHHSGIDDCRNIARICARMIKDGWIPAATWP